MLEKLASFPPVSRAAPEVNSESVGSKCDFVNVALFVIFIEKNHILYLMEIHAPIQNFQDKSIIYENTFLSNPVQHETEKEIPLLLVIIHYDLIEMFFLAKAIHSLVLYNLYVVCRGRRSQLHKDSF